VSRLAGSRNIAPDHPLAGSVAAFDRRSACLVPLVAELRALESRGGLTVRLDNLVGSYVHMFVNRLIRSDARRHELVLYDLLHRVTVSRIARAKAAAGAPKLASNVPEELTPRATDPTRAPES